ncbi:MAG: hypothetical protein OXM01_06100 [Gemmatimonadota bacterium]|nr:hypothetical protein [Gemmatimonadota bacterium]
MRKHATGKALVLHPEDVDLEWFPIRDFVQASDRKMSIDLVEPDGTLVTVSFESHDGQHFVGTYRKKEQEIDGVIRVVKKQKGDGRLILHGKWEKGGGEEWLWIGVIDPDEDSLED